MNTLDDKGGALATIPIIRLRGDINRAAESVIEDAIVDLTTGATRLRTQFFGVKDYDRFRGQRADCRYGMGPSHGHIVFAIELNADVRKRLEMGGGLTYDEVAEAVGMLRKGEVENPLRKFGPPPRPTITVENPVWTAWVERAAISLCDAIEHGASPCTNCLRLAYRYAAAGSR